jgi:lactate dehydrogenase-like 2-hydroxyacid dehydrogenase
VQTRVERPPILLGFEFRGRTRQSFAEAYDIVGAIDRPDPRLVNPDIANRARALVTVGSLGASDVLMAALPNVSIICCYGSGYENIDLEAAKRRGIVVTHSPGANAPEVADIAMALLLASTRRVARADRFIRAGQWASRTAPRFGPVAGLGGRKLGILGLGAIGMLVARRALGFDLEIGYHNRRPRADAPWPYFDSLLALAQWADYLVVACRADDSNRHMIDAEVLRALGPRGHIVNVARGSMIDEAALAEALAGEIIEGAGIDVFEEEPKVHPKLLTLENVVMTPHLGGGTERGIEAMTEMVLRNLAAHFAGRPALTPVPAN